MRRSLLGLSVILTLFLASCGGTPATRAPEAKPTLYQGDWTWSVVKTGDTSDYASGTASFNLEKTNTSATSAQKGNRYAGGAFDVKGADVKGADAKPYGLALMGALESPLDVAFTYADGAKPALLAVDTDRKMQTVGGKQLFEGTGNFYLPDGTSTPVTVVLLQQDTTPSYKLTGASATAQNVYQHNVYQTQLAALRSATTAAQDQGSANQGSANDSASFARQLALSGVSQTGQGAISRGLGSR